MARYITRYPVKEMCRVLNISLSGYYKHRKRACMDTDESWYIIIRNIKQGQKVVYGYRKVCYEAVKRLGLKVNHKKIYRIMVKYGLLSKIRRKQSSNYCYSDEGFVNIYENKLNREFEVQKSNQVWLQDITEVVTKKEGRLYLSAILDAKGRYLVEYKYSTEQNVALVMMTLRAAIMQNYHNGLMLHSDRGYQYTGMTYKKFAADKKLTISMSNTATPKDNAPMESFFSSLKTECIYRLKPKTIAEAKEMIDCYAKFYNNERVILKYKATPAEIRQDSLRLA